MTLDNIIMLIVLLLVVGISLIYLKNKKIYFYERFNKMIDDISENSIIDNESLNKAMEILHNSNINYETIDDLYLNNDGSISVLFKNHGNMVNIEFRKDKFSYVVTKGNMKNVYEEYTYNSLNIKNLIKNIKNI